jgi:predicted ATP-dependent serine protease
VNRFLNPNRVSIFIGMNDKSKIVRMRDISFDPSLFETMRTGKKIDVLLSSEGGFPRSTNFILVGDPGIGKSTVSMDILADLKRNGHSVLFISGEMDRVDLYRYVKRYPKFADLDILFLGEYIDENPVQVIEGTLDLGYDVVLIDSFVEVCDTVKEGCKMTSNATEKWLIDLMRKHNAGGNSKSTYTSFLCIQQVTKEGVFVGSNKLKHNTTGMMELRFTPDGSRFIMFTKNRRGEVNKKLYFDLSSTSDVNYEYETFNTVIEKAAKHVVSRKDDDDEERTTNIFFGM